MTKLTAREVAHVVEQAFDLLPAGEPHSVEAIYATIRNHGLCPDDVKLTRDRVNHRLRNGRKRYQWVARGVYRRLTGQSVRPDGEAPAVITEAVREVIDLKEDDYENLVGALLAAWGYTDVRFTTPRSLQPDGGVDLVATFPMPLGRPLKFLVAVSGMRLTAHRLSEFRGRARLHHRVLVFVHQVSPRVRKLAADRRYPVPVTVLDAAEVTQALEEHGLTVADAIAQGAALREEQYGRLSEDSRA